MALLHIANARVSLRRLGACGALLVLLAVAGCTSAPGHEPSTSASKANAPAATAAKSLPSKPPASSIEVEANKARVAVNLKKNAVAHVVLPPVDENNGKQTTYEIQPSGTDVVRAVPNFPAYFKGTAGGTATVVVRQQSACATGSSCSDKPTEIGSVVLTVVGS